MIVVDSSVWIDRLRDRDTRQVQWLNDAGQDDVLLADLVLMEILQGARNDEQALSFAKLLGNYPIAEIGGEEAAHHTARCFRILRGRGITIRRQIDLLIGSFCILHGHDLLHADRDFSPMARHLGLRVAAASMPPH